MTNEEKYIDACLIAIVSYTSVKKQENVSMLDRSKRGGAATSGEIPALQILEIKRWHINADCTWIRALD